VCLLIRIGPKNGVVLEIPL